MSSGDERCRTAQYASVSRPNQGEKPASAKIVRVRQFATKFARGGQFCCAAQRFDEPPFA
jgi:hypothetical protein